MSYRIQTFPALLSHRSHRGILLILFILAALLLPAGTVRAGDIVENGIHKSFGSLEIPPGTTVDGDVTVIMGDVKILGTVNGHVKATMGKVTVNGTVNGDVEASMGQVIIGGTVAGSVDSKMGEVLIDGQVDGSVNTSLGSITISGVVGQDVRLELGNLDVSGHVLGSIYSEGVKVRITGHVDGDITLPRGLVELGSRARVAGKIRVGEGLVEKAEGAEAADVLVERTLTRREIDQLFSAPGRFALRDLRINLGPLRNLDIYLPFRFSYGWWWPRSPVNIFRLLVLFGLSILGYTLFPGNIRTIRGAVEKKTPSVVLCGFLATLATTPLLIIMTLTIIGIPLTIIAVLFLGVAWIMGYAGIVLLLGEKIRIAAGIKSSSPLGEIALGILLLAIISLIPWVRGLASLAVFILAIGASLYTRLGSVKPSS